MKTYLRSIYLTLLQRDGLFNLANAETVLNWMMSNGNRRPVLVLGAGFSQNAVNKNTGLPEKVPLWSDLIQRWEQDLGLFHGLYDGPRVAELYQETFGVDSFRNLLLSLVPDDRLWPGKAHQALFHYTVEAVITTNQLDTILDKNENEWVPVVNDPDLAIHKYKRETTQLIYLHGHRHQRDSWVFSRSEYEDIERTRPRIVTRVRQLLTMFPVLILGYSLSDPDFHNLYRQLSLDMKNAQPRGLAILIEQPNKAERKHWERLGINLVTFDSRNRNFSPSDKFERFFNLGGVRLVPKKEFLDLISNIKPFSARIQYIRDIFSDETHAEVIEGWLKITLDYEIWIVAARGEFGDEGWKRITTNPRHKHLFVKEESQESRLAESPLSETNSKFLFLPQDRFAFELFHNRLVDALIEKSPDRMVDVADWLWTAIEYLVEPSTTDEHRFERLEILSDLASWIWTRLATKDSNVTNNVLYEKAHTVVRTCLLIAHKYGTSEADKIVLHIEEDAETLGLSIHKAQKGARRYPEPIAETDFQKTMKDGYICAMDGKYDEAFEQYKKASKIAFDFGDLFLRWVSLNSAADNYFRSKYESNLIIQTYDPYVDSVLTDYTNKILDIEKNTTVHFWITRRNNTQLKILAKTIDEYKKDKYRRMFGDRSRTFDNVVSEYWRVFRDLETNFMTPAKQEEYVSNLVECGAFSEIAELAFRLKYDIGGTNKWLQELSDSTRPNDLVKRSARDKEMCALMLAQPNTSTEWCLHLDALSEIDDFLLETEKDSVGEFLTKCKRHLPMEAHTYKGSKYLFDDYVEAWITFTRLLENEAGLQYLHAFRSTVTHAREWETFCRKLYSSPWHQWAMEDSHNIERSVLFLCETAEKIPAGTSFFGREGLIGAIVALAEDIRPGDLAAATLNRTISIGKKLTGLSLSYESQKVVRSAFLLRLLLATSTEGRKQIVNQSFVKYKASIEHPARLAAHSPRSLEEYSFADSLESGCGLIADYVQSGLSYKEVSEMYEYLWSVLLGKEAVLRKYLTNNPHFLRDYVRFLVATLVLSARKHKATAAVWLIEICASRPSVLELMGDVLMPKYWGERWTDFVEKVMMAPDENDESKSLSYRLGKLGLLYYSAGKARHEDLDFVMDQTYSLTLDDNSYVANHAAFALLRHAEHFNEGKDAERAAVSVSRIAQDPRTSVRIAAAYFAPRLMLLAKSSTLRRVAKEIDDRLRLDPYVWVQRQRAAGEKIAKLEAGKHKKRK
jgi:hypothetical protein